MKINVTITTDSALNDMKQFLWKRDCPESTKQLVQGEKSSDSASPVQLPVVDLFLNPARKNELMKLQQWVEEKEAESTYTEVQIL